MKVRNPWRFVVHDERTLSNGVLCGYTRGATPRVTGLGLDAANRKHEGACAVAPISTERHDACHVEGRNDFSRSTYFYFITDTQTNQGVVHQAKGFAQGCANMIDKFDGCCTCAAFSTIDHNKVRFDAGVHHGFGDGKPLPWMTDTEFEADWFAA